MRALLLGVLMCANYGLFAVNMRACAQGRYFWTVATDILIAVLSFTMIRMIGEAGSAMEMASYAAGGGAGSVLGMWITKRWNASK